MKTWLKNRIKEIIPGEDFDVLNPPNPDLGDYSINLPFILAKKENRNPMDTGKEVLEKLQGDRELKDKFDQILFAMPGFINFHLSDKYLKNNLVKILREKDHYGSGEDKKTNINLEFVSANPTGPLTVANIRAASYGDTLANILKKSGYGVTKEYYINDAGNQVRLLGESIARKYLRLKGKTIDFPDNLYQGEYIEDLARSIDQEGTVAEDLNFDELVVICKNYAIGKLVESAQKSLSQLGVEFDVWFSEKKLHESGEVPNTLKMLEVANHIIEKDGAKWLRIDDSGEKDAVVVKSDGSYSYLMNDIAYTRNKFIRGFSRAINIWGADHHGDVLRLLSGVQALNYEEGKLEILLHQLVFITKGEERQRMSKRKGEFVLLDELLAEVSRDAIRFFFLMKDLSTHMEFDIDLAKEESKKNPVFYIQYAFARLNSIFSKLQVSSLEIKVAESQFALLKEREELALMRKLARFPELIEDTSLNYQIHRLAQYAFELAGEFHNFYEKHRVVQENKDIEQARGGLPRAVFSILGECLRLMGLSAPRKM